MLPKRNVLLTGVTSGIGLRLVDEVAQYLRRSYDVHFCVACRNMTKGEELKRSLEKYSVEVTLVEMNVESIKSVLKACQEIKQKFKSIDYVFLNAGIMPTEGVEWKYLFKTIFTAKAMEMFRTGNGLFRTKQYLTDEGVNNIFATNVLGHFALVQQLIPLLKRSLDDETNQNPSKIIWTSSTSASRENFNLNDITGNDEANAYSNSKYVLEAITVELNKKYNEDGIVSYVCDPGTTITNLTGAVIPFWLWYTILPIVYLVRLLIPNLNITPQNACYSFMWLLNQPFDDLDPRIRYGSCITVFNQNYISKIPIDDVYAVHIFKEISNLSAKLIREYS